MSNIVQFPREKRNSPPQSLEEVQENIDIVRHVHVDETMSLLAGVIFDNLALSGFNFVPDDDSYVKDVAFAFEALKSMLYKYHSMDYPIQKYADIYFTLQDDGTIVVSDDENDLHDGE